MKLAKYIGTHLLFATASWLFATTADRANGIEFAFHFMAALVCGMCAVAALVPTVITLLDADKI